MLNKTPTVQIVNRLGYRNMFKNTCFYGHSDHVNFAVQGSFLASPSLLHKELTHESNRLSSRNLINQTSCPSTKVRRSYALVNFMPYPQPRGVGNTGDLTNRSVKFPTTGAKSAVKSPLCPHPHSRGFDNTSRMTKRIMRIFHACD